MIIDTVVNLIKANPLMTTGILATSGGMFWSYLKAIPTKVSNSLWKSFSSTVEIRDNHYDFEEIRLWTNSLTPIFTPRTYQLPRGYVPVPGQGTYWYRAHGHLFSLSIFDEKDDKGAVKGTKITLRVIGRNIDANKFIVNEIKAWVKSLANANNHLKIGLQNGQNCTFFFREKRLPSTIFHSVYEPMKADIQKFMVSKDWYDRRGIPYHRGFLLHGPPGTGKTSIIKTIAGELKIDLYVVTTLSTLSGFLNSRDAGLKIIVMEDIDRDFKENKGEIVKKDKIPTDTPDGFEIDGFKISEFLNVIDGIVSNSGCIFIFTANEPKYLPEAMLRPGRVDRKFEVGYLGPEEIRAYLDLFIEGDKTELENKLLPLAHQVTGAYVQMQIMKHLGEIETWLSTPTIGTGSEKPDNPPTNGARDVEHGNVPTLSLEKLPLTTRQSLPM